MFHEEQAAYERFEKSFTNITPDQHQILLIERLRGIYKDTLTAIFTTSTNSRERSLALTHLETSLMYAVKAILMPHQGSTNARDQEGYDDYVPWFSPEGPN